jgi:hypothetical protein
MSLYSTPLNKYRPFIPTVNYNLKDEFGYIQKNLRRWAFTSSFWGPRVWYYMHNTAAYYVKHGPYTPVQIQALMDWMRKMYLILPCSKCKYWYNKYVLKAYNDYALREICSDAETFFTLIVDIHNAVNIKTSKPIVDRNVVYNYFVT